jgi:hypothetical protein
MFLCYTNYRGYLALNEIELLWKLLAFGYLFVAPETLLYLVSVPPVKIVPLRDALQQLMLFAMP